MTVGCGTIKNIAEEIFSTATNDTYFYNLQVRKFSYQNKVYPALVGLTIDWYLIVHLNVEYEVAAQFTEHLLSQELVDEIGNLYQVYFQ